MDSQAKFSDVEIQLQKDLIKQASELLIQAKDHDAFLRSELKRSWKDRKYTADLNDYIHQNNKTIRDLENEIKDRNSRIS